MDIEVITTQRLILRKLTPEIMDEVLTSYSDEQAKNFLGLKSDEELEKERTKHRKGLTMHNRSFVNFQLISKEAGKIIGACGFHTWLPEHQRAEIGYAITDDTYKGQGLMTEAMQLILRYGFEHMGLRRVEAFIGPQNIPSIKLVAHFHFTREGVMREHYRKNGEQQDSVVYALLKSEYRPAETDD